MDDQEAGSGNSVGNRSGGGDATGGRAHRMTTFDADAVDTGDTVLFNSDLNKEYRFTVAAVEPEWITFETGQKVHRDRFDREDFAVLASAPDPGRAEPAAADPSVDADSPAESDTPGDVDGAAESPAADGGEVPAPNAN